MKAYHCETTEHIHRVKLFKTMQEIGWKRPIRLKHWENIAVNQQFQIQQICKSSEILIIELPIEGPSLKELPKDTLQEEENWNQKEVKKDNIEQRNWKNMGKPKHSPFFLTK